MENEIDVKEIDENEVVETQQILTEEETRQQQVPKIDYEYCRMNNITDYDISRFWEKIKFLENLVDDCWIWTAFKDKYKYGQFWTGSSRDSAHRFSYNLFNGEIAKGLLIRHTCDNPSCVNPHHLLVGSCQDNSDDMVSRNRQTQVKGEDVCSAKLTEKLVDEILHQLLQKVSVKYLAIQYIVNVSTIYDICKGKNWKHCYAKLSVVQRQ